jgi:hypothetical protein
LQLKNRGASDSVMRKAAFAALPNGAFTEEPQSRVGNRLSLIFRSDFEEWIDVAASSSGSGLRPSGPVH